MVFRVEEWQMKVAVSTVYLDAQTLCREEGAVCGKGDAKWKLAKVGSGI